MRHALRIPLISLLLGLPLVTPSSAQQKFKPDPAALKRAQEGDAKYNEARNRKDLDTIMAFYADDAVMVSPFGIMEGTEKIKNWYVGVLKTTSDVVSKTEQAYTDGPVTLTYGHHSLKAEVQGQTVPHNGTFANVLQDNKVFVFSWNWAAEMPPAVGTSSPPSTSK